MKKFVSCALAALLIGFAVDKAAAQQNMSAGIQAGVSLADLGGDIENTDMKAGFAAGAFFGLGLQDYFGLEAHAQYVQKGAKESGGDTKIKVDYIELLVPFTVKIPMQDSPITPRIYAGPAASLLVSCKFTNGGSEDCKDITKNFDFSVFGGVGIDFMVGNGAIMIDALYNLGLTNVNDDVDADEVSVKNKNFQFSAGYRFFLGGGGGM